MSVAVLREPYLIHALPGRVRVRLPDCSREACANAEARLRAQPGVDEVRVSPLTGNALILFDPRRIDDRALLASLRSPLTAEARMRPKPLPTRVDNVQRQGRPNAMPAPAPAPFSPVSSGLILRTAGLAVNLLLCEGPLGFALGAIEIARFVLDLGVWHASADGSTRPSSARCPHCAHPLPR